MKSFSGALLVLLLALGAAHCGPMATTPVGDAQGPTDAAADSAVDTAVADAAPPPTCAQVRASCGPDPQFLVRGHAEGLTGLEGARAQFAVRYLPESGLGLAIGHGVVSAWAQVQDGAFEACVCMPRGANEYPELAAVIFAPGTTSETGRDVVRATYSQRYATLGDEDFSSLFAVATYPAMAEVALAAMVDRTSSLAVHGLASMEGARIFGGLVADERPTAAQIEGAAVTSGTAQLTWLMPGRQWPSERVALVVDRNNNQRCDAGDLGALVPLAGAHELAGVAWVEGAALDAVCAALPAELPRG